jgi:cell division protein FtsW
MAVRSTVDKPFLVSAIILMVGGFFIFSSASLGLLARSSGNYSSVAFSQTVFGLFLGTLAMILAAKADFKYWRKYAFYLLFLGLALNVLVLIPDIGVQHGGARRWLSFAGMSFQPVEILKLAFIIYFAAWCAGAKDKMKTFRGGFLPLLILFSISAGLLLSQPDTGNLALIGITGTAIFIAAGGRWRYVILLALIGTIGLAGLAFTRPYVMERIQTFFTPDANPQGSSYQLQQSLIAIGSGGVMGRGFGQSAQKFNFLPEPMGDSVFAVAAEEFGFVGAVMLLGLFVFFATRGLKIASKVTDPFGRLVIIGIVIMIISQAFVNIGAMLGVVPLSGITLPFVSHGGTSLFITLLQVGIILSISKTQVRKR